MEQVDKPKNRNEFLYSMCYFPREDGTSGSIGVLLRTTDLP